MDARLGSSRAGERVRLHDVLAKVISGGQTGADEAGVFVAKEFEISTGGTMPAGFLTQDGPRPDFATRYGMVEHRSASYGQRTFVNAHDADITIRIAATFESAGEKLTLKACDQAKKPHVDVLVKIDASKRVRVEYEVDYAQIEAAGQRIVEEARRLGRPVVLNVAGNSEKTAKGIGAVARSVMQHVLTEILMIEDAAPGT